MNRHITYEELKKETEECIGELSFEQCLALRCIWEGYFKSEDNYKNNDSKD